MQLYCLNEEKDLEVFRTEVGLLFRALQYRWDRTGLRNLMEQDERYRHIDVETWKTISAMLEKPSLWKNREKYMEKDQEEKEEYNMCQALEEWAEEERSIGREEGRREGQQAGFMKGQQAGSDEKTRIIVRNMLLRSMTDTDIMAIAECDRELIDSVRSGL